MYRLKILLVDKHYIMKVGIIKTIHDNFKNVEIGVCDSASEAISQIEKSKWNIVIMELDLPGRHGMELIDYIVTNHTEINILVFTSFSAEQYAVRVIKKGASYLNKDCTGEEFIKAIEFLKRNEQYISERAAGILAQEVTGKLNKEVHNSLSNREFQIFLRLSTGKSLTSIAEELSLSVKTISTYRSHILKKMNFKNNADIIRYAIEKGFMNN